MPRLGAEFVGTPPSHETAGDKHASASELVRRGLLPADEVERLYVFGTIRNPYDSLVSLYEKMSGSYSALVDDPTSWVHKQPAYLASMRVAREADFSEWAIFHLTRRPAWQLPDGGRHPGSGGRRPLPRARPAAPLRDAAGRLRRRHGRPRAGSPRDPEAQRDRPRRRLPIRATRPGPAGWPGAPTGTTRRLSATRSERHGSVGGRETNAAVPLVEPSRAPLQPWLPASPHPDERISFCSERNA